MKKIIANLITVLLITLLIYPIFSNANRQPELEIISGNQISFGAIGQKTTTYQSVQLKNNSERALNVSISKTADLPFESDLGSTHLFYTTINSGHSKNLRIKFQPTEPGTFQTTVNILSNAMNMPSYTFNVTGSSLPRTFENTDPNVITYAKPNVINDQNPLATIYFSTDQDTQSTVSVTRKSELVKRYGTINTVAGKENKLIFDGFMLPDGTYQYTIRSTTRNNKTGQTTGTIQIQNRPVSTPTPVVAPTPVPQEPISQEPIKPEVKTFKYQPVKSTFTCLNFTDISNSQLCEKLKISTENRILYGYNDNTMKVDNYLSRAENFVLVVRLLDLQLMKYDPNIDGDFGFKDLDVNGWYMDYIKTLAHLSLRHHWAKKLIEGYPDQTLRLELPVNKAEYYKSFFEAIKHSKKIKTNMQIEYFNNEEWYKPYERAAKRYLNQTTFNPAEGVQRLEVIESIYSLYQNNLLKF